MTRSEKHEHARWMKWTVLGIFTILLVILVQSPPAINASPAVTAQTEYYDIQGSTAQELRARMDRLGVRDSNGDVWDAYAKWHVKWRFWWTNTGQSCRITRVETTVEITYTLPRWVGRSVGSSELQDQWDRFITALRLHEEGHGGIAKDCAARIEDAIATMGTRQSCKELEAAANSLGHRILDDSRGEEVQYDDRTQHGRTQGVRFP